MTRRLPLARSVLVPAELHATEGILRRSPRGIPGFASVLEMVIGSDGAIGRVHRDSRNLVVSNLVCYLVITGQIVIKSDGKPRRPSVHIEGIRVRL